MFLDAIKDNIGNIICKASQNSNDEKSFKESFAFYAKEYVNGEDYNELEQYLDSLFRHENDSSWSLIKRAGHALNDISNVLDWVK